MNVLVVARYQEDTSWTNGLPRGWTALVVEKGVQVLNEGREASSFLWAMTTDQVRDADRAAFVQGDPFDHCPDLFERLPALNGGFEWLGGQMMECDRSGLPHDEGLPLPAAHLRWTGRQLPGDTVSFAAGGQFAVPGSAVRGLSRPYLEWLCEESCLGRNPWVMERLWPAIMDGPHA